MKNFFIITRFNLPLWNKDKNNCDTKTLKWLENRFVLFENICFPSVKQQTDQDFYWFVLFDVNTPIEFKQRIQALAQKYNNFHPYFLNSEEAKNIVSYMVERINTIKQIASGVVTLRLDNDDAIHKKFIENIKIHLNNEPHEITVLSFKYGIQYFKNEKLAYQITYPNNHFLVMYEPNTDKILTVYSENHYFISKSKHKFVCVNNKNEPLWIETIHDTNVDNDLKVSLFIKPIFRNELLIDFGINDNITILYAIKKNLLFLFPRFLMQFFRRLVDKL